MTPPADPDDGGAGPGGRDRFLWFEKRQQGLPVVPVTWQGRAAVGLYALLVVVAVVTYTELALTLFVAVFYTAVFGFVVLYKSDLLDQWPPGR